MSEYNSAADSAEKQLNYISPSMCYAKWTMTSISLTNGMTHSCYHNPLHKIDLEEIKNNPSALHNTAQKKQERTQMLAGERPAGCSYCWKIEDSGNRSDRVYRSGESWAQNSRIEIFDALAEQNVNPRYVEVNFNQACNFKCTYCSPHLSTEWEKDVDQNGPYSVLDPNGYEYKHNDLDALKRQGLMPSKTAQADNPYIEAFWKWWPELYRNLEVFRITGGEPLMDKNTFKVLEYIYENPNAWLEMSITTNMCPPTPLLMDKFIEKAKKLEEIQIWEDKKRWNPGSGNHWYVNMALKNLALFVSVDSVGDHAEYGRNGLNFSQMTANVNRFLEETNNTTLTFINTFNVFSVPRFKDYLEYILQLRSKYSREAQGTKYIPIYDPYNTHPDYEIHPRQRIWFDIPLLRDPAWQNIKVLPVDFAEYIRDGISFMEEHAEKGDFVGFYDFEINKAKRNLDVFLSAERQEIDLVNFKRFFEEYDKRSGNSLLETFPEFKGL